MTDGLAIWLYGEQVAIVEEERRRLRLNYTEKALSLYPLGTPLLSIALQVQPERFSHGIVAPFLDGLLPESQSRLAIAQDFNLKASDTFGLISAIGRDCAGAITIQPTGQPTPLPPTTISAEPLDETEIEELVRNLRTAPLGVDERVRVSLGGVQEKLLLTIMPNGSWGRPVDGTPSTHILKPETARFPATVENEAFCMRVAKHLGLPVANIETTLIGNRKLLAVERYDRTVKPDGTVFRIHQEDLCQATGVSPDNKYEDEGGPSLKRIANLLQSTAVLDAIEELLQAVTVNALLGNGDAHGKNFSLLHQPTGTLTLSPLYDLLCTLHYGDDRLAMYIDNVRRTNRVTSERLINEATTWGLSKTRAEEIIHQILNQAPSAIAKAHNETEGLPMSIVSTVQSQLRQLED